MIEQFRKWIDSYSNYISDMGITQVELYENKMSDGEIASLVVTHETSQYIGQITVRNDGHIDIEVLSITTNEIEFYIYLMAQKYFDLEIILKLYIDYIK